MTRRLRIVLADDERPARAFLGDLVRSFPDAELVGEATNGAEAVKAIERLGPDLALLDLEMPEVDGLGVVRLLPRDRTPLVAFITAYDDYAVRAFEVNAVDYLLKPVSQERLRETLDRARDRLEEPDWRREQKRHLDAAALQYEAAARPRYLERIPIRRKEEILLLPVHQYRLHRGRR